MLIRRDVMLYVSVLVLSSVVLSGSSGINLASAQSAVPYATLYAANKAVSQTLENYIQLVEKKECDVPTERCSSANYETAKANIVNTRSTYAPKDGSISNKTQMNFAAESSASYCTRKYDEAGIPWQKVEQERTKTEGENKTTYYACLPTSYPWPESILEKETLGNEAPRVVANGSAPTGCSVPEWRCTPDDEPKAALADIKNDNSKSQKFRMNYDYSNNKYEKLRCRQWLNAQGFPVVERTVDGKVFLASCLPSLDKFKSDADIKKFSWIDGAVPSTTVRGDKKLPAVKRPEYVFKHAFNSPQPTCRYIQTVSETTGLRSESSEIRSKDLLGASQSTFACSEDTYCIAQVECLGNLHIKSGTSISSLRDAVERKRYNWTNGKADLEAKFKDIPYVENVRALSIATCSLDEFREMARDLSAYKKATCAQIPASWCQANSKNQKVEDASGEIRQLSDETAKPFNADKAQ